MGKFSGSDETHNCGAGYTNVCIYKRTVQLLKCELYYILFLFSCKLYLNFFKL